MIKILILINFKLKNHKVVHTSLINHHSVITINNIINSFKCLLKVQFSEELLSVLRIVILLLLSCCIFKLRGEDDADEVEEHELEFWDILIIFGEWLTTPSMCTASTLGNGLSMIIFNQ